MLARSFRDLGSFALVTSLGLVAASVGARQVLPALVPAELLGPELIFADGFESGGLCGTWSTFTGATGGGCEGGACRPVISAPGGRVSVTLGPHADVGGCGGGGSEAYAVLELADISDLFVSTHENLGFDTVLYLREATCDGPELLCNDDADGLSTSTLALANLPPGTYHLFVDSETTSNAAIELDVYVTPPGASSDRCGAPTFVPSGATSLLGSTCGFAADYQPTTPVTGCTLAESGAAEDRVFYFVLPSARTVTVDGCTVGSNYDQTLYLRSVCTDEASQIGCNDDGCAGSLTCTGSLRSSLQQVLQPGLYYLFVDGFQGDCPCGTFSFSMSGF